MNDDKNNGNPGEMNDEIFERIAAEKRRKLNHSHHSRKNKKENTQLISRYDHLSCV